MFLTILTSFNAFDSPNFRASSLYSILEWLIVASVFVAIGSELIGVVWGIRDAIKKFLVDRKKKAKDEAEKKISEIERKCNELIEDEPEFEQHKLIKKETKKVNNGAEDAGKKPEILKETRKQESSDDEAPNSEEKP